MERDALKQLLILDGAISTHTLTWSVTPLTAETKPFKMISTHTLTWSVTTMNAEQIVAYCISTHTLTWSVTHVLGVLRPKNQFQLTRSRGA